MTDDTMALLTQHYTMLQQNLLYTSVTRGKTPGRAGRSAQGIEVDIGRVEATLAGFLYLNRAGLVGRYVFGRNVSGFSVGLSFGF